ncbi:MAG: L-histidine N(alpha)-methyltransferase [Candidatus Moranbacteria bacterium]|nr:L-histidine N(alpha)-methyltransferase [Candidatus Moranbacteria bacterium]
MSSGYLNQNQELEFLSALDSRAVSPLKFTYIGDSYHRWIDIAKKSREEMTIQFEENILKTESLPFILREAAHDTDTVNVVDFGCGDGMPMIPVLEYLLPSVRVRYIAVDISPKMIEAAKRTVSERFPGVEILSVLFDFEKGEVLQDILKLTKAPRTRNYFFLLGNTLGNFDNTDKVLSNLKLSMFPNDALVIGNQISNSLASQRFVEYYRTREVFDLVSSTLTGYGMRCSFKEYSVRWNDAKKQIEMFLTMGSDKRISLVGHDVEFEKGEELLMAVSKKFAEETIVQTFNDVGFRMDFFSVNKKKNVCIASISPTRYRS